MKLGAAKDDSSMRMKLETGMITFFGLEEEDPSVPKWAKSENPPKLSELENDAGYVDGDTVVTLVKKSVDESMDSLVEETIPSLVEENIRKSAGEIIETEISNAMSGVEDSIDEKVGQSVDSKIQDILNDDEVAATDEEAEEMLNEIFGD
jgi:hypothetical protein